MIRSTCLLIVLPCLVLPACQRDKAEAPPPTPSVPVNRPAETPRPDATSPESKTTSDIIHNWRLSDPGKYKCPEGYRLDVVPHKDRQPDKPIIHCLSIKDSSLPPKPAIIKSP